MDWQKITCQLGKYCYGGLRYLQLSGKNIQGEYLSHLVRVKLKVLEEMDVYLLVLL